MAPLVARPRSVRTSALLVAVAVLAAPLELHWQQDPLAVQQQVRQLQQSTEQVTPLVALVQSVAPQRTAPLLAQGKLLEHHLLLVSRCSLSSLLHMLVQVLLEEQGQPL